MNHKSIKLYISVIIVISLFLTFNIFAYAQDPFTGFAVGGLGGASAGGLFGSMAGMSGVNIGYQSDPVNDAMWNSLNPDSVYFNGNKHEATMQGEDIYDYITVDINDWLDAQHDFIQEFVSSYNVQDNDDGYTTNQISIDGYPLNEVYNNAQCTQVLATGYLPNNVGASINLENGPFRIYLEMTGNNVGRRLVSYKGNALINDTNTVAGNITYSMRVRTVGDYIWIYYLRSDTGNWSVGANTGQRATYNRVAYASTVVNTSVYDNWDGVKISIPHAGTSLNPDWTIQQFLQEINDKWQQHTENTVVIENYSEPIPPVPPVQTPLGEVPYDDWIDTWGQHVIDNQESGNDSLENIDTNIQTGVDTLDSIDTNIGTTNGILGRIEQLLNSGINSITSLLNSILTKVQELVQAIVNATETLIAGILNQIPIVFQTAWSTIKQHVSIWHYVVEWVTSISSVLTWVWTMANGTSYYIVLPVYASLAGAVVLALYKKFGR